MRILQGCRVQGNTIKSIVFLYTSNEVSNPIYKANTIYKSSKKWNIGHKLNKMCVLPVYWKLESHDERKHKGPKFEVIKYVNWF